MLKISALGWVDHNDTLFFFGSVPLQDDGAAKKKSNSSFTQDIQLLRRYPPQIQQLANMQIDFIGRLQGGPPDPVLTGFITLIIRVIRTVSHL